MRLKIQSAAIALILSMIWIVPGFVQADELMNVPGKANVDIDTQCDRPLSLYKSLYMIGGNNNDQVKVQLSFKYNIFHPYKVGLYFGYSQYMFWDLYKRSSPFTEINYNPEVFWRFESKNNFLSNANLGILDYIQLGFYEHKSNGRDNPSSRGWDRYYAQIQLSVGQTVNYGVNLKYFAMYETPVDNPNIQEYIGSFEGKIFVKVRGGDQEVDKEEVYYKFAAGGGKNGGDFKNRGWHEVGIKSRRIIGRIRPYIQAYYGYAESLIKYDSKRNYNDPLKEVALRAGIVLE